MISSNNYEELILYLTFMDRYLNNIDYVKGLEHIIKSNRQLDVMTCAYLIPEAKVKRNHITLGDGNKYHLDKLSKHYNMRWMFKGLIQSLLFDSLRDYGVPLVLTANEGYYSVITNECNSTPDYKMLTNGGFSHQYIELKMPLRKEENLQRFKGNYSAGLNASELKDYKRYNSWILFVHVQSVLNYDLKPYYLLTDLETGSPTYRSGFEGGQRFNYNTMKSFNNTKELAQYLNTI